VRTSGPGQSAFLIFDAIAVLNREKIDYAIIGAMAASVHGAIRASMDADAVISLSRQELADLEKRMQSAGFKTELRRGDVDDPIAAVLSLTDVHRNRVDLLIGIRGLDQGAFSRAIEISYHGESMRVVGREDFIAMKIFAGGPQDLVDAERAIAAASGPLDEELLQRLAKGFGKETVQALGRMLIRDRALA
jgi:hypothetical protein